MTGQQEADKLQGLLDLQFDTRKYLLLYETLDGKSGLVSSDSNVEYLIQVLLATIVKLKDGSFK